MDGISIELEASRNPFATIVMAHLKTQETRHDVAERHVWKFRLIRRLYEQGYAKWVLLSSLFRHLPTPHAPRFAQDASTPG
jgi:hypothetical protein